MLVGQGSRTLALGYPATSCYWDAKRSKEVRRNLSAAPAFSAVVKECDSSGLRSGCFCVTLRARPERRAPLLLNYMDTYTKVENIKLSPWCFAVNWSIITLQQKIAEMEKLGYNPVYDIHQLEQLQDLEQFLKMSWDHWMDRFEAEHTTQEVK